METRDRQPAIKYEINICFGSVELVSDYKIENGKLLFGGHAIHRDRAGNITETTEPEYYGAMWIDP